MWSQPRGRRAAPAVDVDAARPRHRRPRAGAPAPRSFALLLAAAAAAASRAGAFCGAPPAGRAPSVAMREAPGQRQLTWAKELAEQHGVDLPPKCLKDKQVCGTFIKEYRKLAPPAPAAQASPAAQSAAKKAEAPAPKRAAAAAPEPMASKALEPKPRAAPEPKPRAKPVALSPQAVGEAVVPKQVGLYADLFKIPTESFPENAYRCVRAQGVTGNPREPRGHKVGKSMYYVWNIWPGLGDFVAVNTEGPDPPANWDCSLLKPEDLEPKQRADLVAVLMQVNFDASQSERWAAPATKSIRQPVGGKSMSIDLRPAFNFRGFATEEGACVSATMTHRAVPPKELNLGLINVEGKKASEAEAIVKRLEGMKVLPVATERGEPDAAFEVCAPAPGQKVLLDEEERQRILGFSLRETTRASWENAEEGSLLLHIAENCRGDRMPLTYLASALRPTLGPRNQEKLKRVLNGFQSFAPGSSGQTSSPEVRNKLLAHELARQRSRQAWLPQFEHLQEHNIGGSVQFGEIPTTKLVLAGGKSNKGFKGIYSALELKGPVRFDEKAKAAKGKLHAIVFGKAPTKQELKVAQEICDEALKMLARMKVGLDTKCQVLPWKDVRSPEAALDEAGLGAYDMALLFGSKSLRGREADDVFKRVKKASLRFGEESELRHLASQWVDLSSGTWFKPNRRYSVQNIVEAAVAKLGHVPFGVDISAWGSSSGKAGGTLVVGYDVCHIGRLDVHVAAGVRVSGDESQPNVLTQIGTEVERVQGEMVPEGFLRQLVPPDGAENKLVIVHRDGRFRGEANLWERYYEEELKPRGASLQLVEVVKTATGVPRVYKMGRAKSENVGEGTYLRINEREYILASTGNSLPGTTIHPMSVSLARTFGAVGAPSKGDPAWVKSVFDLSYMHHGSVFKKPKLPVTTLIADRFANMVANWNLDLDDVIERKMSGSQQPWL